MALQPKPELTFDDWLQGEYVGGEIFALNDISIHTRWFKKPQTWPREV